MWYSEFSTVPAVTEPIEIPSFDNYKVKTY